MRHIFISKFLDFGQFSIDSREVNIKNNQKRLMFFLFYTQHLACKLVMLLHKVVILLMHSVSFFLYEAMVP